MRTIVVANHKGGSGKTTTTVNLAAALGELGFRVLVIDLDPQGAATSWLGVSGMDNGVVDAIAGRTTLAALTYETSAPGVLLVPASPSIVAGSPTEESRFALGFIRAIEGLPALWDLVLVDSPPSMGYLSIAPMTICNEVLIPVEAHALAVMSLATLFEAMRRVRQRLNPSLDLAGLVACRVDQTAHARALVERLAERFPESFMKTVIRENVRLAEAPSYHLPITQFAPGSGGAEDYRALAAELMGTTPVPTESMAVTVDVSEQPTSTGTSALARLAGAISARFNRVTDQRRRLEEPAEPDYGEPMATTPSSEPADAPATTTAFPTTQDDALDTTADDATSSAVGRAEPTSDDSAPTDTPPGETAEVSNIDGEASEPSRPKRRTRAKATEVADTPGGAPEAGEASEPSRPKRRTRAKATEVADTPGGAPEAGEASEPSRPKRRTRAKATEVADTPGGAPEAGEASEPSRPKRRTRAKATEVADTPGGAPEAGEASEPSRPKRRTRAKATEVADTPGGAPEAGEASEPSRPKRRTRAKATEVADTPGAR